MIYVGRSVRVYDKAGTEYAGVVTMLRPDTSPRSEALRVRVFDRENVGQDFMLDMSCLSGEINANGFAWQYI